MIIFVAMIVFPYRHKGLDPLEVEEENGILYITTHQFKYWDMTSIDPKAKGTYVCDICSAAIHLPVLKNRAQVMMFNTIKDMNSFFGGEKNPELTTKWRDCEEMAMIDILNDLS